MPKLTIDNREVEVPRDGTILDAARKLGIDIPTLCFRPGHEPRTSCMVCLVKLGEARNGPDRFVPSCGTKAADGMRVESETEEVREARKAALELLLSDHVGDCIAPCQRTCPARMDIPLMIRQIAGGDFQGAIVTVKEEIALPAVLGRICPAPCEKGCRRRGLMEAYPVGRADGGVRGGRAPLPSTAVSICLLKRFAADVDLASGDPYLPPRKPQTGKKVAIVGAGPAGLAAAYYLLREGHDCTLLDDHDEPGGMLRRGVPEDRLPREVLDAEIGVVERMGAEFRGRTRIGQGVSLEDLRRDFDAVLLAAGQLEEGDAARLGVRASVPRRADNVSDPTAHGIERDALDRMTSVDGVFAAGAAVRPTKMAVRSVADGRACAVCVTRYLTGAFASSPGTAGPEVPFTTQIGKLKEGEIERFAAGASGARRVQAHMPGGGHKGRIGAGLTPQEAREEAGRCLHCDCRKRATCKLRLYAQGYGASPRRYLGERRTFEQDFRHPDVVYEPGKCVACGICVMIAEGARHGLGLAFIGRGFDVRVGVPLGGSMEEGLKKVAAECVAACPTGALAFKLS